MYYTYCSYETNKGTNGLCYIGYRKCPEGITPEKDQYFGSPSSPKNKDFAENPNKAKIILGTFETKEKAIEHEIYLHNFYNVDKNPKFANQAKQTSVKFSFSASGEEHPLFGKNHKPETCEKISRALIGKLSGENHPIFGRNRKNHPFFRQSGKNHPRYGQSLSKEHCEKISQALTGENHPNYGKQLSPVTKKRIAQKLADSLSYTWIHVDGQIEYNLTRLDLRLKYPEVTTSGLYFLVHGKLKSHKGWSILHFPSCPICTLFIP